MVCVYSGNLVRSLFQAMVLLKSNCMYSFSVTAFRRRKKKKTFEDRRMLKTPVEVTGGTPRCARCQYVIRTQKDVKAGVFSSVETLLDFQSPACVHTKNKQQKKKQNTLGVRGKRATDGLLLCVHSLNCPNKH